MKSMDRRRWTVWIGLGLAAWGAAGPAVQAQDEPVAPVTENVQPAVGEERSGTGTAAWLEPQPGAAGRRAFAGAPPVMPHSFAGDRDGRYCLECHAREDRIEKRQRAIAPVPHPEFTQCQQCHVNGSRRDVPIFRTNDFTGLVSWGKGDRAHPFAPPTVPHPIGMRENCLACHGPTGRQRIATAHPWRSQCLQCHVPDAGKTPAGPVAASGSFVHHAGE